MLILLSSINSINPMFSLEYSLFYFRFLFFAIGIFVLLKYQILNIKNLIYIFTLVYAFVFLDAYYQFFFGYDLFNNKYDGDRLSGLFGEEKILGSFIARTYPLYFGLICIYKKNSFLLIVSFLGFILSDIIIIVSGDRTSAFYLFFACFAILILNKQYKIIRLATLIISIVILYFIFVFSPFVKGRLIDKTIDEFLIKDESNKIEIQNSDSSEEFKMLNLVSNKFYFFSETHHNFAKASIKMASDFYFLGIGPKLFRVYCNFDEYKINGISYCSSHPHNTYFQLIAETGLFPTLIVFSIFLLTLFYFLKQFYYIIFFKKYIYTDAHICFLICIFISLWPIIPTGNFFGNWMNGIFYFPLGFLMYENYKSNIKNENIISN